MISRLLRRLQGHAVAPMPPAAPATLSDPSTHAIGVVAPADALPEATDASPPVAPVHAFVRHLLDAPPGAAPEPGLCDDVLARLDALSRHLDVARLPRLPAMVPQLLAALRRDDADANSLATLISRDPSLAGDVVRVAGSAHYARANPVASLPQAIGTIGFDGLRYVVLTTVMRPILQADPSHQAARTGERLAQHGEARTWLCGPLAAGRCDVGEAQLASVVASTGLAALLRMLPRSLLAQAAADDAFAPALLVMAGELSARAAMHWRFDAPVREALATFAAPVRPDSALAGVLADADRLAMVRLLRDGDVLRDDAAHAAAAERRLLDDVSAALRGAETAAA